MLSIRRAQPVDAGQIAPLMDIIFDEMQLEELEDVPEPGLAKVITKAYRTRTYLSSKASTVVAEANGQVVGVVFGYPSENEREINNVLYKLSKNSNYFNKPYLPESETDLDEWYLDSIAVDPAYQGMGIGNKLLDPVPEIAERDGKKVVGLNVDLQNPKAESLYLRKGFRCVGIRTIGDHYYKHMQKLIKNRSLLFA